MTPRQLITLVCALCFSLPALAQNLYRWVDDKGRVSYSDQPPPPKISKFQEKRLGINTVTSDGLPYEVQKATQNFPVTLYTQSDCSACQSARELLTRRGVPFTEVSLRTEEEAAAYRQTFGKELFVPSVTVGSQKSKGFDGAAWGQLLDAAGYPKTALPGSKPVAKAP